MDTVLLDGPDGSAKTTLANLLVKKGFKKLHFGVPSVEALKSENSIFKFYFDPIYKETVKLVTDRCHLAEPIYGPVMRGGTPMTHRVELLLERYLEAIDAQIVICLPPYRVAFNNWIARKGAEYVKEASSYRKIYDGYARLLFNRKRNHNFVWYDYTRRTGESFAQALIKAEGFPLPYGVVGSQRPRFLFVGERPGESKVDTHNFAFLTPEGSSGFLFNCLREAGYQEREIAFVNAFKRDGSATNFSSIVNDLTPRGLNCIIALGNIAFRQLMRERIKCISLEHPQFVKRFKQKDLAYYVHTLKEIRRQTK